MRFPNSLPDSYAVGNIEFDNETGPQKMNIPPHDRTRWLGNPPTT
jgi:hypothetical protein